MVVVEEWLSSTEPGLQAGSPPFFPPNGAPVYSEKVLHLRSYLRFVGQSCSLLRFPAGEIEPLYPKSLPFRC